MRRGEGLGGWGHRPWGDSMCRSGRAESTLKSRPGWNEELWQLSRSFQAVTHTGLGHQLRV